MRLPGVVTQRQEDNLKRGRKKGALCFSTLESAFQLLFLATQQFFGALMRFHDNGLSLRTGKSHARRDFFLFLSLTEIILLWHQKMGANCQAGLTQVISSLGSDSSGFPILGLLGCLGPKSWRVSYLISNFLTTYICASLVCFLPDPRKETISQGN